VTPSRAKPTGLSPAHAAQFQDASIVRAYALRAPYPPQIFEILAELAGVASPAILDLGCGTGDLTVGLSAFAAAVDAVDPSANMIAAARTRPLPRGVVRWIEEAAETAPLAGPYDLVTAAESLHWMDWDVVFPRLQRVLKPGGFLAIVAREYVRRAWWDSAFQAIIDRHSTNREYERYDLIAELGARKLWKAAGHHNTRPIAFRQSVEELIGAFHSRNGFSTERMGDDQARAFDLAAADHLNRYAENGMLDLGSVGRVFWGTVA
jgi:SAM-dependent methyltransferase